SKIKKWRIAAFVGMLACAGASRGVEAGPAEQSEWWSRTDQSFFDLLLRERKDIADVAQELNRSKPASGPEAMRKLNVLLRAGLWSEAMKAVDQLHAVCPELANNAIQSIFHTACDEFEAWEVARQLVEVFADNIQELPLESPF